MIPIPRQALVDLLQASGSSLTPEQYLASLTPLDDFKKYPGRTKASIMSKNILLVAAVISGIWVCLPFGFDVEGVLVALALAVITFFEYRVHGYFRDMNPHAPLLGLRNQSALAAVILVYGLYHAFLPFQVPVELQGMIDSATMGLIRATIRGGYIAIGILGGVSQFALAWYYWTARSGDGINRAATAG